MELLINSIFAPLLTMIVGAFSGWFFTRRKQNAEAQQSELDTVEKAVSIWRQIAQDLKKEMEEQSEQITNLRTEVEALRKDNASLLQELRRIKRNQQQQHHESHK